MEKTKVLIAYATATNSTKEISEYIGHCLQTQNCLAEIISAKAEIINILKYDLIVIGSAIQGNNPLPAATEFILCNQHELRMRNTAVFAVCGTISSDKQKKWENALTYAHKLALGITPISQIVLGGNMPSSGKKFEDFLGKLFLGIQPGDYRDWDKIKDWAIQLIEINDALSDGLERQTTKASCQLA